MGDVVGHHDRDRHHWFRLSCLHDCQYAAAAESTQKKEATKTWLCFWLIAGLFNVVLDNVLFFIPYYAYIKASTFGAMMVPSLNAPCKIYDMLNEHVLTKIPGLMPDKKD